MALRLMPPDSAIYLHLCAVDVFIKICSPPKAFTRFIKQILHCRTYLKIHCFRYLRQQITQKYHARIKTTIVYISVVICALLTSIIYIFDHFPKLITFWISSHGVALINLNDHFSYIFSHIMMPRQICAKYCVK